MAKHIVLITTGQPASNPRLVKEADTLATAGYQVTVIYCFWSQWAQSLDQPLLARAKWKAIQVGGSPVQGKARWYWTRIRSKILNQLFKWKANPKLLSWSSSRAFFELRKVAKNTPADLFIAHNLGALPVAKEAAQFHHCKFAFDAEDFHRGESGQGSSRYRWAVELESRYIPDAAYCTAASPLIAEAYQQLFPGKHFVTINNVFPKTFQPTFQELTPINSLRLFWFSQTIGLDRGLQDVIHAINFLDNIPMTLTLVGSVSSHVESTLKQLLQQSNTEKKLEFIPPLPEPELIQLSATHHIGLALERNTPLNRSVCLTNKVFTYLLAGNAIVASATPAQQQFIEQNPQIGKSYPIGDIKTLARHFAQYYQKPQELEATRRAAWNLAHDQLNWETEQQKWLPLVEEVL